jgi:RNA-directed DNA polymerase
VGLSYPDVVRPLTPLQPAIRLGAFYRSESPFLLWHINEHLARWAMHKFKRFRGKYAMVGARLHEVYQQQPDLFAH